ncbi:MAG TPA: flagellar export chaperone FliS [Geothrix sp.]|jgi:flagellar protein FliS
MNAYAQSADTYLVQRVMGASPEQQAALLMEAGQRYLGKAIKAIEQKDHLEVSRCFIRVTEIINESISRLNLEDGGELAQNLSRVYDWWTREIFEASSTKDTARLKVLSHHMGELRQAWEQLHEKQAKAFQGSEFKLGDRVV